MFPGATAQVYRNEAGEPLGWDYPSAADPYVDEEELEARWLADPKAMVCETHGGWALEVCPNGADCVYATHVDEWCCGPDGCCEGERGCCGTFEDALRGRWHVEHEALTALRAALNVTEVS